MNWQDSGLNPGQVAGPDIALDDDLITPSIDCLIAAESRQRMEFYGDTEVPGRSISRPGRASADQQEMFAATGVLCEVLMQTLLPGMNQLIDNKLKSHPDVAKYFEPLRDDEANRSKEVD